ncbi:MAG: beta-hydroxyacyl-ACP dehydratase [Spirochaetia bacterium]|nr:beta-hydroxyacyl-ACP dehydratase [Spirochaetia bacterium]
MSNFESAEELLTHRAPFLYLDELLEASDEGCVGTRYFGIDEPFFQGHFPDYPVVPGVILLETLAQTGGAGLRQTGVLAKGTFFVLASIEKAKFRNQVRPGDTAIMSVEHVRVSRIMIRQKGTITVDGKVACEASWMCIVGKRGDENDN